jgi:hypothetical protein
MSTELARGQRYVILPPAQARYLPERFAVWYKAASDRIRDAGLDRLPLRVICDFNSGELSMGYEGDHALCERMQRIFADCANP